MLLFPAQTVLAEGDDLEVLGRMLSYLFTLTENEVVRELSSPWLPVDYRASRAKGTHFSSESP